jgi:hypothetical protein
MQQTFLDWFQQTTTSSRWTSITDYLGVGKSNNEPPFLEGLDHLLMTIDDFGGLSFLGLPHLIPITVVYLDYCLIYSHYIPLPIISILYPLIIIIYWQPPGGWCQRVRTGVPVSTRSRTGLGTTSCNARSRDAEVVRSFGAWRARRKVAVYCCPFGWVIWVISPQFYIWLYLYALYSIYICIFVSIYIYIIHRCYPSPRPASFCMVDMSLGSFSLLCSLSHALCFCSG